MSTNCSKCHESIYFSAPYYRIVTEYEGTFKTSTTNEYQHKKCYEDKT